MPRAPQSYLMRFGDAVVLGLAVYLLEACPQSQPQFDLVSLKNLGTKSLLGWRPSLVGWRPSLLGWRPSLLVFQKI